jgi:hypothetical protein
MTCKINVLDMQERHSFRQPVSGRPERITLNFDEHRRFGLQQ